ncbi:MAG: PLP-dependent aspartate aminotransferase family protein, partial [Pyrinomonadaceae bacterium]
SIYGGSVKLMTNVLRGWGISTQFIALNEITNLPALASKRAKAFWFETPANPINRIVDLNTAARVSREAGLFSIVDNTFASPVLQQPLKHGVDAVMHSATKYLGGHSDLTAGAIVGSKEFIARVRQISITIGTTLDPAAAYLLGRGIKTLDVRVRAACDNALQIAQFFRLHPKVKRVYYPGLEDDPGYQIAKSQMREAGAIVAVDLVGGEPEVERFFNALRMVRTAPSLGGVESLVSYPLYSSHAGFSPAQLESAGVSAATVRFALGIESIDDITEDIENALQQI